MTRMSLGRDDFVHLIRGGTLTKDSVEITLQDIGFGVMLQELNALMRYIGLARLGEEKMVGEKYKEKTHG